jgi:4-carboxymuconolactone decarboxylase
LLVAKNTVEMLNRLMGKEVSAKSRGALAAFDKQFADLVTDTFYGTIWNRPGLDVKSRIIVAISALAAIGRPDELRGCIHIGLRNGVTLGEIKEIVIQISQYAGMPASIEGARVYNDVVRQVAEET